MGSQNSPQLGYNHNIPHRGRLYHVQTEDSGLQKAHIFTHVFFDGTIIASNKVLYNDKLEDSSIDNLDETIIGLMQESHKTMIRALRKGKFDEKIIRYIGPHPDGGAKAEAKKAPKPEAKKRPERRPPPPPREVAEQGPPLRHGPKGSTVNPSLSHPVFASAEARAQVTASAAGQGSSRPSRGPNRMRRRAVGGIGGRGVAADGSVPIAQRRDVIVGKFASEHQAQLDEEILALLREDGA